MSSEEKSSAVRQIIIGITTTVAAGVILAWLGLGDGSKPIAPHPSQAGSSGLRSTVPKDSHSSGTAPTPALGAVDWSTVSIRDGEAASLFEGKLRIKVLGLRENRAKFAVEKPGVTTLETDYIDEGKSVEFGGYEVGLTSTKQTGEAEFSARRLTSGSDGAAPK